MPELNIAKLAALDPREYIEQIKAWLRNDEAWLLLLAPELTERTRLGLDQIIASIDRQRARIGDTDPEWTRKVMVLRGFAKARLDAMPAPHVGLSSTKEARAWRAFSARLARQLAKSDPAALEAMKTPYGGLSAAQWLNERGDQK